MNFLGYISDYVLPCLLLLLLLETSNAVSKNEQLQTYIIHLDHTHKPVSFLTHESWHRSILNSLSHPVDDHQMLLYSYNHVLHGFSARLTKFQLSEIETSPAHLATYPESFGRLHTTHSPNFLGLNHKYGLWPTASYGEGVIIGVVDTGIWPESESFKDKGMPPVPRRWKGKCENGTDFSPSLCNKKLIGARSFSKGLLAAGRKIVPGEDNASARDSVGHGTHVSSTAAGNFVHGVSYFGYGRGTAKGVAPRSHIAMYKALFAGDTQKTATTDVLAAMDQAIADGVDILSLSLGNFTRVPYFKDLIAIASLSAVEKGIFVVCSGGNGGKFNITENGAPWITTIGAGTTDRSFTATMTLEDGMIVEGISYYPESIYLSDKALYYGKGHENKSICYHGELDPRDVHGKIVLCGNTMLIEIEEQEKELVRVGAYAGIFITDEPFFGPVNYNIPSIIVPTTSGALLREHLTKVGTTPLVKSLKFGTTKYHSKPAPQVAYFSSRGPDPFNPDILKPDIIAPGVDILAATVPNKPVITVGRYRLVTDYTLMSGASMATPHVAGLAALLKHVHPDWSPAAIRSAMMTTAYTLDNTHTFLKDQLTRLRATPLACGAGHIDPNKAMDPGLIYDLGFQDYVNFLCGLGYSKKQMKAVINKRQWNCTQETKDLNYPSFMAIVTSKEAGSPTVTKFNRVVTNVGIGESVYQATLEIPENFPPGLSVKIEPTTLSFSRKYQKKSFSVTIEIAENVQSPSEHYAYLKWIDGHSHVVSSPIEVLLPP